MTHFQRVKEWMREFGQEAGDTPTLPELGTLKLRHELIHEEALECLGALTAFRMAYAKGRQPTEEEYVHLLKELADLIVVTVGTFAALGVDGDHVTNEVINNNYEKLSSRRFSDSGKLIVPPEIKKQLKQKVEDSLKSFIRKPPEQLSFLFDKQ